MGYFIRNILVYGAIAVVLWMLYSGIRGLSKKKKNDWFELNLNCINTLRERYNVPVGYSGHEASVSPSFMAAMMGATAIERHITLNRAMYGSDQAASLEPSGLKQLVGMVRKIPVCMGDGIVSILPAEIPVAEKLRYWNSN